MTSPRRVMRFVTLPAASYTIESLTAIESVHGRRLTRRPRRSYRCMVALPMSFSRSESRPARSRTYPTRRVLARSGNGNQNGVVQGSAHFFDRCLITESTCPAAL